MTEEAVRARELPNAPCKVDGELRGWLFENFERFCGALYIAPKDVEKAGKGRIPFRFNKIQKLYNATRTKRDIVLKPRQIGFTTLEQARDVYHFLTVPGSRVVVVCQSISGAPTVKLLSNTYQIFFASLRALGLELDFASESTDSWKLADTGSTLTIIQAGASEAAANKKGRAGTITRLHETECAFWEFAEETTNALFKCVPTSGEIVVESTANGASGVFYDQWCGAVSGKTGFKAHFFPWFLQEEYRLPLEPGEVLHKSADPARALRDEKLTQEQIKWWRREKANETRTGLTEQEYPDSPETCFLTSGRGFFHAPLVEKILAMTENVAPVETQLLRKGGADATIRYWRRADPARSYVVALDTAEGKDAGGGSRNPDRAAGIVLERGTGRHVATIWGKLAPEQLARAAVHVARRYNDAEIVVERNNHGHACLLALGPGFSAIGEYGPWPNLFVDLDGKLGWLTNEGSRTTALDNLEMALRKGAFNTLDHELVKEMRTFVVTERGRAEANKGNHDDLVLASAIALSAIYRVRRRRDFSELPSA